MEPSNPGDTNNNFPRGNVLRPAPYDSPAMIASLPRDSRGSLEIFNPVGYSSPASALVAGSNFSRWVPYNFLPDSDASSQKTRADGEDGKHGNEDSFGSQSGSKAEHVHTWMAFTETENMKHSATDLGKRNAKVPRDLSVGLGQQSQVSEGRELDLHKDPGMKQAVCGTWTLQKEIGDTEKPESSAVPSLNDTSEKNKDSGSKFSEAGMAERVAEWGLILKRDDKTGKPQGVGVRTSGESGKSGASQRASGNSMRTSEESDCGNEKGIPHMSNDLKDVLSAFQQTFVVSDATNPDYPIMYASAGFFKMTGYNAKEVIGRNCRFLQGAGTDPADVSKIREALAEGRSYCGRLLNYKKDGMPFWNLLTIAPIKDETGKILKFIGMLVEVSKHTEGDKEKMVRPNGLPESLIRYDARQKEMAVSSVTELVLAVKNPHSFSESRNHSFMRRSESAIDQMHTEQEEKMNNLNANFAALDRHKSSLRLSETYEGRKKRRKSRVLSFLSFTGKAAYTENEEPEHATEADGLATSDNERPESLDNLERKREIRRGLDLATTLERIEKNFVITDPRLPDNPIIFASDSFLELTEYTREDILGKNCRFLQGPETDPATVKEIREAIENQREVTVQLINYTKTGKKFWNIFHLQPMRDQKGEVQYFIGVQLDGTQHVKPHQDKIPEQTEKESAKVVKETAENVDEAVRELPDANLKPEDLWMIHSRAVLPKPHKKNNSSWKAIEKILERGEQISLKHFKPLKYLGYGDTGSVHLVELNDTGELFAMKTMDKSMMLNRNKVHRVCTEREILDIVDHPFVPTLYASFQTKTHICLITDYCPGGELFMLIDRQPKKVLREDAVRFYSAEVVIALEYLHCQGIIYRDLKPENILLQGDGHLMLTDFDLSCLTSCKPQVIMSICMSEKKKSKRKQPRLMFVAEPIRASNSFVGTEEYIAPEIIKGSGHSSAVDWWALGILLYEMLYGYTPFRGKTRQKTFSNILHKDLKFPSSVSVSLAAIQLIHGLLNRDPTNRLGSYAGANEIKQHPFFRGVNWGLVRSMRPPKLVAPAQTTGESKGAFLDWSEREALLAMQTDVF
uniref:non-specific serine/threonine protein kinase n=1 Tax=Wollemia nobilis TaxID=56998 RepID=A0A126X1A7_9CONI|nr:putative LOV domain-containing protein [Wollemia nobilis]